MVIANIRWPAFIVTLVLAFALFSWWTFIRAASGVSPVTDRDYYSHGLKYNSTNLEREAGEALGWTVTQQVEGRLLTIRVEDGQQSGVVGCQGVITFPAAGDGQGAALPPLTIAEVGSGVYRTEIPDTLPATLIASLTLSKGQAQVQRRLLLALAP